MSHTAILLKHNLIDSDHVAKVEYFPVEGRFVLDEEREPIWWDEDIEISAIEKIKDILNAWLTPGWEFTAWGQWESGGNGMGLSGEGNRYWFKDECVHREDGPAVIRLDGSEEWWVNGKRHREGGPAVIMASGYREWRLHGELHRLDGPAVIWETGEQEWWAHGKCHREDGPAVIYPDGREEWFINGEKHRLDGPAVIGADGTQEWWIHGKKQSGTV